jgi:hypothetical protein
VGRYGLQRPLSIVTAMPQVSRFNRFVEAPPVPCVKWGRDYQIDPVADGFI